MTASAERRGVTVIGAGPAGLAAAVEAARGGITVTLIDAGDRFGGQFWRHGATAGPGDGLHHDTDVYDDLDRSAQLFIARGAIDYRPVHHVWSLTVGGDDDGAVAVHALDRAEPGRVTETVVESDYLILATGAYDRQLPFPGWDLPGVLTVGAAQSLLKGSGVVVGPRVLVAGTGPFLLPVATALAEHGAQVVGVVEASHPRRWLRHLPVLALDPRRLREAAGYAAALARHRVRVRNRSMVIAAHGRDRLEAVSIARLGRSGYPRAGRVRRIAVDVLAVGYGFTGQTELARAAGCRLHVSAEQTLVVDTDEHQQTSMPRVFAAGEVTGIGGAQLATTEGAIAGAAVAARASGRSLTRGTPVEHRLAPRRATLRRFATAMHAVYPVPPAWLEHLEPATIVCRCEEVTVAEIDHAIELGARDTRTAKLLSRSGMGWCQGRECGYATACIVADRTGAPLDLTNGADRPVASPISLGLLADVSPSVQ